MKRTGIYRDILNLAHSLNVLQLYAVWVKGYRSQNLC